MNNHLIHIFKPNSAYINQCISTDGFLNLPSCKKKEIKDCSSNNDAIPEFEEIKVPSPDNT